MDSIAKCSGKWQRLEDKPIKVFPSGVSVPKRGFNFVPSHLSDKNRTKRGKITQFGVHTRKRLRQALLTKTIDDSFRIGFTLTVPWKGTNFEPLMDEFRECFHRFEVAFRREFPNSGFIYRVELQRRGAPHVHALSYIAKCDLFSEVNAAAPAVAADDLWKRSLCNIDFILRNCLWVPSVPDLHYGSYSAFEKSGVKVEPVKNDGALMRYICDHTSKHKQAQLGYKGKQWGIVGSKNFRTIEGESLPDFESERHAVVFFRTLRKVMRYRLTEKKHHWKRPPVFGSVLKGSRRNVGEFYLSRDTVLTMWNYSKKI